MDNNSVFKIFLNYFPLLPWTFKTKIYYCETKIDIDFMADYVEHGLGQRLWSYSTYLFCLVWFLRQKMLMYELCFLNYYLCIQVVLIAMLAPCDKQINGFWVAVWALVSIMFAIIGLGKTTTCKCLRLEFRFSHWKDSAVYSFQKICSHKGILFEIWEILKCRENIFTWCSMEIFWCEIFKPDS